jgi:transcriptional regulator with XRE-family HTH domain
VAIGGRVRGERQSRRWTLDQLAEAAGVSRRMVVSIEQGTVNPSVGTLLRISDALGVGLPALVEPPSRKTVNVVRAGDGAVLWTGESGGTGVLVASTQSPDIVELWEWTLNPGERHTSEAHAAGTTELLHVHDGSLAIDVADESVVLDAGDALSFPGDRPHSYTNGAARPVRFTLAVYEPAVGSATRPEVSHG